jgi:NADH-quinone oxidoreductase subunit G
MSRLIIDGTEIEVSPALTLLQACEQAGAEIPRFCYHERLSIAGNCRMCLVEVVGEPKPVASCARAVKDLRPGKNGEPPVVNTRTPMVRKAREGVMEFLLINHPLDCPICDQGGECDLQDQAMAYGVDTSRYAENKRAVEDKYIGPLVKTIMNRCIHCTRCVRFTQEVAGVADLGATGRGEDMEITSYLESAMHSELQGNIIDLCPVGALTSKPYAFKARPWELTKTDSIDVMDALGSSIRIDSRGREVMRILPRTNDDINEEWISDKTRFIWDGLRVQRLDRPYVREFGKLRAATWHEAFHAIAKQMPRATTDRIGAIAGDLCSVEDMFALKLLAEKLGVKNVDARQDGSKLHPKFGRGSYIFNARIAGVDEADAIVLVGTNPRLEAPVLNARIRKRWLYSQMPVALIGERADLTYDYQYLGAGPESIAEITKVIGKAQKPLIIAGARAFARPDGEAILAKLTQLPGFSVLHTSASRVGALDINFMPSADALDAPSMAKAGALDLLFNLGADEIEIEKSAFVVYIGTHGDKGAERADVILPGAAYTEKPGIYVNTEGRVQYAARAVFPPGDAREDWAIIRALSEHLQTKLPFDSLAQLRALLHEAHPHMMRRNQIEKGEVRGLKDGEIDKTPFKSPVEDFYLTNPIARASKTMAECSRLRAGEQLQAAE